MNKIVWVCLYVHRNLWKDSKEESNTSRAGKESDWGTGVKDFLPYKSFITVEFCIPYNSTQNSILT